MNLIALNIPDDTQELRRWLENEIVGLNLRDLVDELEAILPNESRRATLAELCGEQLPAVLSRGLSALDDSRVRGLLRQPKSLFELQEAALTEGSAYWRQLNRSSEHNRLVDSGWEAVRTKTLDLSSASTPSPLKGRAGSRDNSDVSYGWVAALVALAATLVIAIHAWQPPPGWGWNRSDALNASLPPRQYLDGLADSAQEWFKKPTPTAAELTLRLKQFRRGCDTLIAAPHTQLAAEDRRWLVDGCRKWASKLDQYLADVASGQKPVAEIKNEADATINKLIEALRHHEVGST